MHDVHEVPETATQTIQLPDDERVARSESLQTRSEARSVIFLARDSVAVEAPVAYACTKQRIPL
jgi:hypothetical protein